MRALVLAVVLCGVARLAEAAPVCPAQAGDCEPLMVNGELGVVIDLVFVGDGYTEADRTKFYSDATAAAQSLFSSGPYQAYKNYFNAWALFVPSTESGADHPSRGREVSTAFDAAYDYMGLARLIYISYAKVFKVLNTRFPAFDFAVALVNDAEYGGAGGNVTVVSTAAEALDILRHELAHTSADLADEYEDPYPGFPEGDPEPNVASVEHLDPLKWQAWVKAGTPIPTSIALQTGEHEPVGAYEGARFKAKDMFRPTPECMMRTLGSTFCPVCSEAMVLAFTKMASLVMATSPAPTAPVCASNGAPASLVVTPAAVQTLAVTWSVDGQSTGTTATSLLVAPAALGLSIGAHTVSAEVQDMTPLVRTDPGGLLRQTVTWNVDVAATCPGEPPLDAGGPEPAADAGAPPEEPAGPEVTTTPDATTSQPTEITPIDGAVHGSGGSSSSCSFQAHARPAAGALAGLALAALGLIATLRASPWTRRGRASRPGWSPS